MGSALLAAFGLMLVIEGLMPLAAPSHWREAFRRILSFTDGQIRFAGLASVLAGAAIVALAL